MSTEIYTLAGTQRDSFGKGVARKLRAAGSTPAVVYGHGMEPIHVAVNAHSLGLIVRKANALISLEIDGAAQLVLVKDVQRDTVRQIIEHIDLVALQAGETVEVEIPIHLEGTAFAGANALQELGTLRLSVLATAIPENIVIDVEGLEAGVQIHAGEIVLPEGATLLDLAEQLVVNVAAPRGEEEDAAAAVAE
jgi:large subunit ribosomal protein L25